MGGHPHGGRDSWRSNYFSRAGGPGAGGPAGHSSALTSLLASSNSLRFRGRQLLDHEGLSCLLILLFLDDPKINTTRLHRILRNLCYHAPTREWVVKSLLSILEKSNEGKQQQALQSAFPCSSSQSDSNQQSITQIDTPPIKMRKSTSRSSTSNENMIGPGSSNPSSNSALKLEGRNAQPSWLNISMDAALGFRANVFQINKIPGGGKKSSTGMPGDKVANSAGSITIHSGASAVVCRHTLEMLISLAKSFPAYFLPWKDQQASGPKLNENGAASVGSKSKWTHQASNTSTPKSEKKAGSSSTEVSTDFWDTLLRLDIQSSSKKGKGLARSHSSVSSLKGSLSETGGEEDSTNMHAFEASPFGQLLSMLSCPVIRRSSVLTDKLLRLLSLISVGQSLEQRSEAAMLSNNQSTTNAAQSTSNNVTNAGTANTSGTKKDTKSLVEQNKAVSKNVRDMISSEHLKLAVEVLTSKSCSEEGLEDVTALLLNLSYGPEPTRDNILKLLLEGAQELGNVVRQNVIDLQAELRQLKSADAISKHDENDQILTPESKNKGALTDRFTNDSVVLTAPVKVKGGSELQLPSMNVLTNKTSSQAFFLRVLKVIIQLRDAALLAIKKAKMAKSQQTAAAAAKVQEESEKQVTPPEVTAEAQSQEQGSQVAQPSTEQLRVNEGQKEGGMEDGNAESNSKEVAVGENAMDVDLTKEPGLSQIQ